MKLVLLTSNYPFGVNGDNVFIKNEIDFLAGKFDEVTVVSTGSGEKRKDVPKNVKVIQCTISQLKLGKIISSMRFLFAKYTLKAYKELKLFYPSINVFKAFKSLFKYEYAFECLKKALLEECQNADIVYSYWFSSRAYAYAKLKKQHKIENVFVTRSHRFDCYLDNSNILPYRNFIGKELDEIIFISKDGKKRFEKEIYPLFEKKCKLEVSYLGVNKEVEEQKYYEHNELCIVSCSNIISVKRLDIIIKALSIIEDIRIRWIHFGDGDKSSEIKKLAKEYLEKKSNIVYEFKGAITNEKLMEFYHNNYVDLFVNTSDSEGIPVSIMEAISFGIPVISRDVGGNSEINCGNNSDYLLSSDADYLDFANAIKSYCSKSKEEKEKRRKEVLEIFKQQFSRTAIKDHCNKLAELVNEKER